MKKSIILFTKDFEEAKKEILSVGGHVTQKFTDNVLVVNLPDSVDPKSLNLCETKQPNDLDEVSNIVVKAWAGLKDKNIDRAPSPSDGISWDSEGYSTPNHPEGESEEESFGLARSATDVVEESTGTPTSLYMTGSIAVGLVIVSGESSDLKFSSAEQQKIIQEVQEGLTFLANEEPRAKISFVYDIRLITVSAAPGSTATYESAEGPWRNEALGQMGYSANRNGSIDYVNDLRQNKGTNWAYVAYFTKYPLRHFAYAVYEKTTMHYGNNGWGVDNINKVFAHETCHVFGAADEYGSCQCGGSHGYKGVPNNNCVNCAGAQETCLMSGNNLQLCQWSRGQIGWDEDLFPDSTFKLPVSSGIYTIQQKSNNRFLDAHESASKDFSVVTRTKQNNSTQKWKLHPVGTVYTIQQKSNGRFLDAHTVSQKDFNCVTRTAQNNATQKWVAMHSPSNLSNYSFQQLSNGRYLDAWEHQTKDFSAVTRNRQNNDTQKWTLCPLGDNTYHIQHLINGRYLDAHTSSANDFSVVTRNLQNNNTQKWILTPIGGVYTIMQMSSKRLLDAHTSSGKDFSAVTRTTQDNSSQQFVVIETGAKTYTIQQLVNGRHLDAHTSSNDFSAVTRSTQNNNTQRWLINKV